MRRRWLMGAGVVIAASFAGDAGAADTAKQTEGKKAFATGVNLVNDPDGARYEEALPLFRKAYDLLANWKVLGNIGICSMKIERDGDAIDAFDRYLKDGGKEIDAAERAQVSRDLDTLKVQASTVHFDLPAGSEYLLDERLASSGARRTNRYDLTTTALDLRLRPGLHKITLHGNGHPDITWDAELAVGAKTSHRFDAPAAATTASASAQPLVAPTTSAAPPPPPPAKSGLPTSAYVAGGVTLALVAGAVVTGIVASSKHSTFESINGQPGHTTDEIDSARSSGKSMALVSTVLTGAAILGGGLTAYFALSGKSDDGAGKAAWIGVGPGSLAAGGTF